MKTLQLPPSRVSQNYSVLSLFSPWTLFAFFVLTFIGCQTDQSDISVDTDSISNGEILSYLEQSGYHLDHLDMDGEYVIYEDVVFKKADVITDMMTPYQNEPDEDLQGFVESRQRGVSINNALTMSTCESGVRLYIANSILADCGPNVHNAILDAVEEINSLRNLSLKIHLVDDRADATIIIASDLDLTVFASYSPFYELPSYTALAYLSFLGQPGPRIAVDPSWEAISQLTIKSAMIHELLHTVGMHHTGTQSGEHIHHTPEWNDNSIMTPYAQSTGKLSYFDKKALWMYYAAELDRPESLKLTRNGDSVQIKYTNEKKANAPYYWVRVYRYHPDGTLDAFQDFPDEVNQGTGIGKVTWDNQPRAEYSYRIKGMNFKQDVKSKISRSIKLK